MRRSEYLNSAGLQHGDSSDDFADLIDDPSDDRILAGLRSGFTRALFNAAVAVKHASDPASLLPTLIEAFQQTSQPDNWRIIEKGEADAMTLELIQIELIESAAFCGEDALPFLEAVLESPNNVLHFAVFNGMEASKNPAFFDAASEHLKELKRLPESESALIELADRAMCACLPF